MAESCSVILFYGGVRLRILRRAKLDWYAQTFETPSRTIVAAKRHSVYPRGSSSRSAAFRSADWSENIWRGIDRLSWWWLLDLSRTYDSKTDRRDSLPPSISSGMHWDTSSETKQLSSLSKDTPPKRTSRTWWYPDERTCKPSQWIYHWSLKVLIYNHQILPPW